MDERSSSPISDGEFDPFSDGSDSLFGGVKPTDRVGPKDTADALMQWAQKASKNPEFNSGVAPKKDRAASRKANQNVGNLLLKKAIDHFRSEGYLAFRADRFVPSGYMMPMVNQDFLGFGDALAFKLEQIEGTTLTRTRVIAIQSTTREKERAHVLKYVDPTNKVREGIVCELLQSWFGAGCELVFALGDQEGHGKPWKMEYKPFTPEMFAVEMQKKQERMAKRA